MQTPAKTFPMTWSRDCEQCEAGTTFSKSRRIFWLGCLFHVDHAAFFGPHQEACVSWTMWPVNASTPVPVPVSGWQAWVFFQPNRIAPPTSHKFWSWIDQKKCIQWEANSSASIFSEIHMVWDIYIYIGYVASSSCFHFVDVYLFTVPPRLGLKSWETPDPTDDEPMR